MIFAATHRVDGSLVAGSELDPSPVLLCIDQPGASHITLVGSAGATFDGWAVSMCSRAVQVVARVGEHGRPIDLSEARPDVIDSLDASNASVVSIAERCGFRFHVSLPEGIDELSVELEASDGDYIARSNAFVLRRGGRGAFDPRPAAAENAEALLSAQARGAVDDPDLHVALERVGGIARNRVLELGSATGVSTAALLALGAREVIAIEGRPEAFVDALVRKELRGLSPAHFVLGDFMPYLRETAERFDMVVAWDVLEHQREPIEVLRGIARVADRLVLRARTFDGAAIEGNALRSRFSAPPIERDVDGRTIWLQPCAWSSTEGDREDVKGPDAIACWLSRDDLFAVLDAVGFREVHTVADEPAAPGGPRVVVAARRQP